MSFSERAGPGVLVLHEFFGLQQSFRTYADALESEGFTVLVPDLYDGAIAGSVEEARALASALDAEVTMRKIDAAAEHLSSNWHPRLGVVGFSLGADFAWALAHEQKVEATVVYYGVGDTDPGRWGGPVLGHFADNDEWTPLDEVQRSFQDLEEAGIDAEMHVYAGTGHWFANASVDDAFDEEAANLALTRTVDFLRHHLA